MAQMPPQAELASQPHHLRGQLVANSLPIVAQQQSTASTRALRQDLEQRLPLLPRLQSNGALSRLMAQASSPSRHQGGRPIDGLAAKGNDPHDSSTSSRILHQPSDVSDALLWPRAYLGGADLAPPSSSASITSSGGPSTPLDWALMSSPSAQSAASARHINSELHPAAPVMSPLSIESATAQATGSWASISSVPVAAGDAWTWPVESTPADSLLLSPVSNLSSPSSLLGNVSTPSESSDDGDKSVGDKLDRFGFRKGDIALLKQCIDQQEDPNRSVFPFLKLPILGFLARVLDDEYAAKIKRFMNHQPPPPSKDVLQSLARPVLTILGSLLKDSYCDHLSEDHPATDCPSSDGEVESSLASKGTAGLHIKPEIGDLKSDTFTNCSMNYLAPSRHSSQSHSNRDDESASSSVSSEMDQERNNRVENWRSKLCLQSFDDPNREVTWSPSDKHSNKSGLAHERSNMDLLGQNEDAIAKNGKVLIWDVKRSNSSGSANSIRGNRDINMASVGASHGNKHGGGPQDETNLTSFNTSGIKNSHTAPVLGSDFHPSALLFNEPMYPIDLDGELSGLQQKELRQIFRPHDSTTSGDAASKDKGKDMMSSLSQSCAVSSHSTSARPAGDPKKATALPMPRPRDSQNRFAFRDDGDSVMAGPALRSNSSPGKSLPSALFQKLLKDTQRPVHSTDYVPTGRRSSLAIQTNSAEADAASDFGQPFDLEGFEPRKSAKYSLPTDRQSGHKYDGEGCSGAGTQTRESGSINILLAGQDNCSRDMDFAAMAKSLDEMRRSRQVGVQAYESAGQGLSSASHRSQLSTSDSRQATTDRGYQVKTQEYQYGAQVRRSAVQGLTSNRPVTTTSQFTDAYPEHVVDEYASPSRFSHRANSSAEASTHSSAQVSPLRLSQTSSKDKSSLLDYNEWKQSTAALESTKPSLPIKIPEPVTPRDRDTAQLFTSGSPPSKKVGRKQLIGERGWLERTILEKVVEEHPKGLAKKSAVSLLDKFVKKAKDIVDKGSDTGKTQTQTTEEAKTKPTETKGTALVISLRTREQNVFYSELEFELNEATHDYLMAQFQHGRINLGLVQRMQKCWEDLGRPKVVGFHFDLETQLNVIRRHVAEFKFYGPKATSPEAIYGCLKTCMQLARAMRLRTYTVPDVVIASHLRQALCLYEIIGAPDQRQIRLAQIRDFARVILEERGTAPPPKKKSGAQQERKRESASGNRRSKLAEGQ